MTLFRFGQPRTSITVAIERLSNLPEMDWFTLEHLLESMAIQENGPKEVLDVIQRRLKDGTSHQQVRLLEVLNCLIERSHLRLLNLVVTTSKLKSRLKWVMKSKADVKVKTKIVMMLEMWVRKYRHHEPKVAKFSSTILQVNHRRAFGEGWLRRTQYSPIDVPDTDTSSMLSFTPEHQELDDEDKEKSFRRMSLLIEPSSCSFYGFSPFSRRYQNLSLSSKRHSYLF